VLHICASTVKKRKSARSPWYVGVKSWINFLQLISIAGDHNIYLMWKMSETPIVTSWCLQPPGTSSRRIFVLLSLRENLCHVLYLVPFFFLQSRPSLLKGSYVLAAYLYEHYSFSALFATTEDINHATVNITCDNPWSTCHPPSYLR